MFKALKNIIQSFQYAREFEISLDMMRKVDKNVKRYQVKITRDDIAILRHCAAIGIKNEIGLADRLKPLK